VKGNVLLALASIMLIGAEGADDNTTRESKELKGAWSVRSVMRNRNELPAERRKDLQMIFQGGRFAFKQGNNTLTEGTFRLNLAKAPRTIDLTTIDANGINQTTLAIYDLSDDSLKICGAQPGENRPGEFATMDGSGHTMIILRRAK
jgi:uncharacterized protein (TIGR03067 family)